MKDLQCYLNTVVVYNICINMDKITQFIVNAIVRQLLCMAANALLLISSIRAMMNVYKFPMNSAKTRPSCQRSAIRG